MEPAGKLCPPLQVELVPVSSGEKLTDTPHISYTNQAGVFEEDSSPVHRDCAGCFVKCFGPTGQRVKHKCCQQVQIENNK